MCGIVGAVAERSVVAILLEGLKRLEYRGYDSAGLAVFDETNHINRVRVVGKVHKLVEHTESQHVHGNLGIAQTRWATHGVPHEANAHPHISNDHIALVHNGIIENFEILRDKLIEQGYQFTSQTDTEVAVHLLHSHYQKAKDLFKALQQTAAELKGAYALAIMCKDFPDQIWAIRKGSPLVIGVGFQENFLASDQLALLPVTQRFIYLQEGDMACLTVNDIKIWDESGNAVTRPTHESYLSQDFAEKGPYRHFMQKEIFEQPSALQNLIDKVFIGKEMRDMPFGQEVENLLTKAKQVYIVACGTSYHAALVAKYWFEAIAKVPCAVEIASEFRYRDHVIPKDTLFVSISQSGETADTLAALRIAKELGFVGSLAICNVPESSLARESDATVFTLAGPEIGVASTKAFTAQLLALLLVVLVKQQDKHHQQKTIEAVLSLPRILEEVLKLDAPIRHLSQQFVHKYHMLYLGRGTQYPIALEGALKLKELSYIHAEAYPAGELKHGPLALVDESMPIIILAPKNTLFDKVCSNTQEVKTRDGQLYIVTDDVAAFKALGATIEMPAVPEVIEPIVYTIPLQLLSYHVAVLKGTDVDQPRNLAKSVTVE